MMALTEVAERQCGVVRRGQLAEAGWTRHHIAHEIGVGRWTQVASEVIAMQNAPLVRDQLLWLGVLHAGRGAVLSHGTTLEVNGLQHWTSPVIDVLVPKSDTIERLDGFFFHETRRDYLPWIHPLRSPPQLRLEEASLLAAERKRSIKSGIGLLAASVQQGLTRAERLLTTSMTISKLRHGRHFRLALLDVMGGAHSFAEVDVGRRCRQFGLAPPLRQVFRYDRQGRRRYLDCVWELPDGTKLVLEVDGSFHLEAGSWWRDIARERGVVIDYGKVVRCSTYELRHEPAAVMHDLAALGVPRI